MATPSKVVVCGAGVIGASTAYHLALRQIPVTIVERHAIAGAASGKAGGFLALDWCDGSALGPLARRSFEMHAELATSLGVDYGYRRVETLAVTAGAKQIDEQRQSDGTWLDGNCVVSAKLGTTSTTAQVQPDAFTRALVHAACERGAAVVTGCVEGIEIERNESRVSGVRIDGAVLGCDAVVIAMGPWSALASQWLGMPAVGGLKGSSIVLRPRAALPAHALFVDYTSASGQSVHPEVYTRPNGDVYLCGVGEPGGVPDDPAQVLPSAGGCTLLREVATSLSRALRAATMVHTQACFRPIFDDGLPLIGAIKRLDGAYIATGHNCWGILNAPATGAAMAELIGGGRAHCVDLSPFDVSRLSATA